MNGSIKGDNIIINNNNFNVPSNMFKIIIYKKNNQYYYICYVAENRPYYFNNISYHY